MINLENKKRLNFVLIKEYMIFYHYAKSSRCSAGHTSLTFHFKTRSHFDSLAFASNSF